MRIEGLQIEGFGHYGDRPIGTFDNALTVVRGQNEAGKSTLLAFMRAVLFGFPTPNSALHYPPLRGGRHGGRIMLRLDDGREFTVERIQGSGKGPFKAWGENGDVVDEATFSALIGHASETLFRSAFTFNLDDLPSFKDADGDLGALLYGASMGAEQLPQAVKRLDGRIDHLFVPRGSSQKIAHILRGMEEATTRLREVDGQADDYRRQTERRDQIEAELKATQALLSEQDLQRRESERRAHAWEDWTSLRVLDERLAALEDTGAFPPDGPARLERAEEDLREAKSASEEATSDLEDARSEAERSFPDANLLEFADEIEGLRRGRAAVDGYLRDLPERQAELAAREEEVERRLKTLGPGWDEERLFAFDLSIPRRAEIEQWQRRFEELRTDQRDSGRDLEDAIRQSESAAEAQRQAAELREQLEQVPDEEAVGQRSAGLRGLRDSLDRYERSRQRLADLEAQQPAAMPDVLARRRTQTRLRLTVASLVVGIMLAIGAVVPFVFGESVVAAVVGLLGALALVAAGALAVGSRRVMVPVSPISQMFLDGVRDELVSAEADLRRAAIGVIGGVDESMGPLPNADVLRAAEEALDQVRLRTIERGRADERARETLRMAEQALRRQHEAAETLETARVVDDQANLEWNEWLRAGDLPTNLAPQTAGQLLTSVEVALAKAEELRDWRHRVEGIRDRIQQYRDRVQPVASALGIELTAAERAAVEVADAIIDRFETARADQAKQDQARATATDRERAHKLAAQKATVAEQALADLLTAAGVKTPDEFHVRAAIHEERGALKQERGDCEMRLRQLIGPEPDALEALDQALRETTIEEIEAVIAASKAEIEEAQEQRDGLLDERGQVTVEIQQLHDDDDASEARSQIALLTAEIEDAAREWSSLVVARALLRNVREQYERERQPAVIQRASDFFSILTGGRYPRLYRPFGEQTVTVEDGDGQMKRPDHLSRGTKEQLYLALRLGAIEEAASIHEGLPVIIDEVLVNFDPDRARRAVEAFVQLATRTQVIVFTCHPWIADLFEDVADKPPVLDLD